MEFRLGCDAEISRTDYQTIKEADFEAEKPRLRESLGSAAIMSSTATPSTMGASQACGRSYTEER